MAEWWAPIVGALLVALVLVDVYLTVLYARAGTGIISRHLAHATWFVFRNVSGAFGPARPLALSLCGPTILVLLVGAWAGMLDIGTACIIQPALGRSVTADT